MNGHSSAESVSSTRDSLITKGDTEQAATRHPKIDSEVESRILSPRSAGKPLPDPTLKFYEQRFNRDLGHVRLHVGPEAAQLSEGLQSYAFTHGTNVWLGSGFGAEPSHVLAHELAHVLQQQPGTPNLVQRFASTEHVELGSAVTPGPMVEQTGIRYTENPNDKLSFGEMVAMAGDYFGSVNEMARLSETLQGREQLAYARAKVTGTNLPTVSAEARKSVDDRYFRLASANRSHFSGGGSAAISYESQHVAALVAAYQAGQQSNDAFFVEALNLEAFSQHYLSDMFSGGHIRTPRTQIQSYYSAHYANSVDLMKQFLRDYLVRRLNALNPQELKNIPDVLIAYKVDGLLDEMAGSALSSFSLGDLVSLAMHDFDNAHGVPVVSAANSSGQLVPGGFHWTAMGDNEIGDGGRNTERSRTTFNMALASMRASRQDLDDARKLGIADRDKQVHPWDSEAVAIGATNALSPFKALTFVPHEDVTGTRSGQDPDMNDGPLGDWHWGRFSPAMRNAFEVSVRTQVVEKVREAAARIDDPKDVGIAKIHARQAVIDLAGQLSRAPLTTFEALFGPAS